MAGSISRDGIILDMPSLDEQTRAKMVDSIVAAFLGLHPDLIQAKVRELESSENN